MTSDSRIRLWLALLCLLGAALFAATLLLQELRRERSEAELEATRGSTRFSPARSVNDQSPGLGVLVRYTDLERTHTLGAARYATRPPMGGAHSPVWQNCGVYTTPVRDPNAVHALEHGAVWITYRPGLKARALHQLEALARQPYVLVSPYPAQPAPVILTAWGLQLWLERADDPRVRQFLTEQRLRPTAPEPGAPCTRGTGLPVQLEPEER